MQYRENITIAFIRDNGARRSLCLSRRLFLTLVLLAVLLAPLGCLAVWQAWHLWRENDELAARLALVENELGEARTTAERLDDLNVLLTEAHVEGREYLLRNLANAKATPAKSGQKQKGQPAREQAGKEQADSAATQGAQAGAQADSSAAQAAQTSGASSDQSSGAGQVAASGQAGQGGQAGQADATGQPAQATGEQSASAAPADDNADQEQFQGVNSGYVRVENVTIRLDRQRRQRVLRVALDLHNGGKQETASGNIEATLLTTDGEKTSLRYTTEEAGNFRINHYKRAVMLSQLPQHLSLTNAQVILEVRNHERTLVYSNLYPVEQ